MSNTDNELAILFLSRPDLEISNQWIPILNNLIAHKINEARIDELEKLKSSFKWGNGTDDIDERLAQLKGTNQ